MPDSAANTSNASWKAPASSSELSGPNTVTDVPARLAASAAGAAVVAGAVVATCAAVVAGAVAPSSSLPQAEAMRVNVNTALRIGTSLLFTVLPPRGASDSWTTATLTPADPGGACNPHGWKHECKRFQKKVYRNPPRVSNQLPLVQPSGGDVEVRRINSVGTSTWRTDPPSSVSSSNSPARAPNSTTPCRTVVRPTNSLWS